MNKRARVPNCSLSKNKASARKKGAKNTQTLFFLSLSSLSEQKNEGALPPAQPIKYRIHLAPPMPPIGPASDLLPHPTCTHTDIRRAAPFCCRLQRPQTHTLTMTPCPPHGQFCSSPDQQRSETRRTLGPHRGYASRQVR